MDDGQSFVIGDMPGIIEGAAEGIGLGLQFLRHIERTKVLLHILDMSGLEGREPFEDYQTIKKELESYDMNLLNKPQLIIANKMDMPDSEENLKSFIEQMDTLNEEYEIYEISALRKEGLTKFFIVRLNYLKRTKK